MPGSADAARLLDRAEMAALLEALDHPAASVRIAVFEALIRRLPLAPVVWLEVGAYVGAVLDSSESVAERLAAVDASPWVPPNTVPRNEVANAGRRLNSVVASAVARSRSA